MTDRLYLALTGVGLTINGQSNVIVRNLKISKVLADNGDAITIQASKNVWVDHVDLSSDLDHDKDYYDGLVDVTHASEWVTISNSYIHDHVSIALLSMTGRFFLSIVRDTHTACISIVQGLPGRSLRLQRC